MLWILGFGVFYGNVRMQILDRTTGILQETALTPRQAVGQEDLGRLPLTDDGRFLLCLDGMGGKYGFDYVLIDAEALLQGSTDWTPVTTLER